MTRCEKIEALLDQLIPKWIVTVHRDIFRDCVLAGLKLRDEELLAMEFDSKKANEQNNLEMPNHKNMDDLFEAGALWQFEQFMKILKQE